MHARNTHTQHTSKTHTHTYTHLLVNELHDLVVKQQPATSRLDHRHVVPMVRTPTDVYDNGEQPALFRFVCGFGFGSSWAEISAATIKQKVVSEQIVAPNQPVDP